jgi:hypothetical protein
MLLESMIDHERTTRPRGRLRAFHFESACLLLLGAALWVPSGCGASAASDRAVGGETHFLNRCITTCDQGLSCLDGFCTVPCSLDEPTSCPFDGAACREAAELGSGVCDVACVADSDCLPRGSGLSCDDGQCRGAVLLSTELGTNVSEPDAGDSTAIAECARYRDQAGEASVSVVIVNERSEPVYVQSPGCTAEGPRYVAFDRPVLFADARGVCGSLWCQSIQDEGYDPVPCPGGCASSPLVRIEPGGRFDAGTFRSEGVWHGSSSTGDTPRMPEICFESRNEAISSGGVECTSEVPMAGSYSVTSRAFANVECPAETEPEEPCQCTPNADGSCVSGAVNGTGEVTASVTFSMPAASVDIVFR